MPPLQWGMLLHGERPLPLHLVSRNTNMDTISGQYSSKARHCPPASSAHTPNNRFLTTNFSASLYWTKSNPCGLRVTDTERPPDWTGFPESRLWIFSKTSFSFEPGWEKKKQQKIKLQVDMIVHTYTNASIWGGG